MFHLFIADPPNSHTKDTPLVANLANLLVAVASFALTLLGYWNLESVVL
jgi:hypothetical protein